MIPHWQGRLSVLEQLFNRKLSRGRSIVENSFEILKQTFRELIKKSDLHITFLPDVVTCCILLNMLLGQNPNEVERLMEHLVLEGLQDDDVLEDHGAPNEAGPVAEGNEVLQEAQELWTSLAMYLGGTKRTHMKFSGPLQQ